MKQILIIFAFFTACISSEGQKFLRYQMNDNTFNGFYTESIENITHDYKDGIATTFVKSSGKIYEIPVANINDIIVEDVSITNSNIGEYRIYEFNYEEGDVKKIYVDNRACLFSSHNGDFSANDTILFSSAYNDVTWIFYTDGQGHIKKFFDGNRLFYFDYDSDGEFTVLDLSNNDSKHYSAKQKNRIKGTRAPSISFFTNITDNAFYNFLRDAKLFIKSCTVTNLAKNIEDLTNNPELHNQFLIVDGLYIAGDIIEIGASILTEVPSLGLSSAGLALNVSSLAMNWNNLLNHLWPDSKQMDKYKEYYQNKYGINIETITPENVKCNKADLQGTFKSHNGVQGNLYFTISKLADTEMGERIAGSAEPPTSLPYIVKGSATNLKPGTNYFYMLWYECEVDGLHFTYPSDNGIDFTTPKPSATTIGTESVEDKSAVVKYSFSNVPEGAQCGVQYGYDGNNDIVIVCSSDGENTVNLTGLKPSTNYSYRAFIQYEGENYYGETKSFTTDMPDISGTWTCVEHHVRVNGSTYEISYVLTLGSDGTVQYSESSNIYSSSWSFKKNGEVQISIMDLATQSANSAKEWKGTVDNIENPTKITGATYRWNVNHIGYFQGDSYSFEMTRTSN